MSMKLMPCCDVLAAQSKGWRVTDALQLKLLILSRPSCFGGRELEQTLRAGVGAYREGGGVGRENEGGGEGGGGEDIERN